MHEIPAPEDGDVLAGLLLEFGDRIGDVPFDQRRVLPLRAPQGSRGHILLHAVQMLGVWVVARRVRPEGGHDLVGLPPKQVRIRIGHALLGGGAEDIVEVRPLPPAVPESSLSVLIGSPGCLVHTVKGQELDDNELSHGVHSLPPCVFGSVRTLDTRAAQNSSVPSVAFRG